MAYVMTKPTNAGVKGSPKSVVKMNADVKKRTVAEIALILIDNHRLIEISEYDATLNFFKIKVFLWVNLSVSPKARIVSNPCTDSCKFERIGLRKALRSLFISRAAGIK
jgi:hypothetical protein